MSRPNLFYNRTTPVRYVCRTRVYPPSRPTRVLRVAIPRPHVGRVRSFLGGMVYGTYAVVDAHYRQHLPLDYTYCEDEHHALRDRCGRPRAVTYGLKLL